MRGRETRDGLSAAGLTHTHEDIVMDGTDGREGERDDEAGKTGGESVSRRVSAGETRGDGVSVQGTCTHQVRHNSSSTSLTDTLCGTLDRMAIRFCTTDHRHTCRLQQQQQQRAKLPATQDSSSSSGFSRSRLRSFARLALTWGSMGETREERQTGSSSLG